jgi:hypothetical protein
MDIMRSQGNMTWINMPWHYITFLFVLMCFYFILVMDYNFFPTFYEKNTCCDFFYFKKIILFVFEFLTTKVLNHSPPLYMFIYYICIIHQCIYLIYTLAYAFIKVWTQDLMEMHQSFNHQTILLKVRLYCNLIRHIRMHGDNE